MMIKRKDLHTLYQAWSACEICLLSGWLHMLRHQSSEEKINRPNQNVPKDRSTKVKKKTCKIFIPNNYLFSRLCLQPSSLIEPASTGRTRNEFQLTVN